MNEIFIQDMNTVFCRQGDYIDGYCLGTICEHDGLFLINKETQTAKKLPDKYQNTPIIISPYCGGYTHGLIMVSLLGEDIPLAYHHNFYGCAGMWGWIDIDFNTVIEPQYIFAENFIDGKASVSKGRWIELDNGRLDWADEAWGIIDTTGQEIVPCIYDELYSIENTDVFYLAHKGGWKTGNYCIVDSQTKEEILQLDFNFDAGYMFNSISLEDDKIIFVDHQPGEGTDIISAFDLRNRTYIVKGEQFTERTLNGKSSIVVNKDGKDIIIF